MAAFQEAATKSENIVDPDGDLAPQCNAAFAKNVAAGVVASAAWETGKKVAAGMMKPRAKQFRRGGATSVPEISGSGLSRAFD
ncbi:hypothetical protein GCM10010324_37860 [Streptomyces hiroshimensis]|uniref:Uncharacterized protein n=1 Tax=Streptomyces hiroshimensis TaxID=66424 RepID=A0ABQ2YLR8_9ACTN|nr:hypothetical protein GCM10010324_37860 [Streptomyces hiroshimensis]